MAQLETQHLFQGVPQKVFAGIASYDKYHKHLPGVTKTEILPPKVAGSKCRVRYELNLIKTFYYVLNMFEDAPRKVSWTLDESNLMKDNRGSWTLQPSGKEKTQATYTLELKFGMFVPSAITDSLAKANLPAMMAGFQKLIDETKVP
jgi:coenzyme Q-binding protein COQ10